MSSSCTLAQKLIYGSYGVIGISVVPFAIWCTYKHVQFYHSNKTKKNKSNLLYRLSLAIYIATIISSISGTIATIIACYVPLSLWLKIWYIECIFWVLQWMFFILLLFSRYCTFPYSLPIINPFFRYRTNTNCTIQSLDSICWLCV